MMGRAQLDIANIGPLLAQVLARTPYPEFLFLHVPQVGIVVDDVSFLFSIELETGAARLRVLGEDGDDPAPPLQIRVRSSELERAAESGRAVEVLEVRSAPQGRMWHPALELAAVRSFGHSPFPLSDREELVYSLMFGAEPPAEIWRSKRTSTRVLYYSGTNVAVSSGLTDPLSASQESQAGDKPADAGYELLLQSSVGAVVREFASWVQYTEETGEPLLPGNWLEYEGGRSIPGTNVSGFLIVPSSAAPRWFPVGGGLACWHEALPVDQAQLQRAKSEGVLNVAAELASFRNP